MPRLLDRRPRPGLRTFHSDGRTEPSLARKAFNRARFELDRALVQYVEVPDEGYTHSFRCVDPWEVLWATTVLAQEQGTIDWIRSEVKPGDVFYDIGASIGGFSLVAGRRVGPGGVVYAFEPNIETASSLLHNVGRNGLDGQIKVLSSALSDKEEYIDFDYLSDRPGAYVPEKTRRESSPLFTELKQTITIDRLVESGAIRPCNLAKIDVDGLELAVVKGMRRLLTGEHRPRAVQIEVSPESVAEVRELMEDNGFAVADRNYSSYGLTRLASGEEPDAIIHNIVFRPR